MAAPEIEWDEFVAGHRKGLIQWNTARLGPWPGEPGCRAPAEVLRENGYRPSGSVPSVGNAAEANAVGQPVVGL
jgi:hypothetical protein